MLTDLPVTTILIPCLLNKQALLNSMIAAGFPGHKRQSLNFMQKFPKCSFYLCGSTVLWVVSQYLVYVNHYSIKRQLRADFSYTVHSLYFSIQSSPLVVTIHLPSGFSIQWLWIMKLFQISTSCLSPLNRSIMSESVIPSCMHLSTKTACFRPVSCKGLTLSLGRQTPL